MKIWVNIIREKFGKRINDIIGVRDLFPAGIGFLKTTETSFEVVTDTVGGSGTPPFIETQIITTDNVLPPLSFTPKFYTNNVWMTIGKGWLRCYVGQGFTVNSLGVVTLVPGAQFTLKAGWLLTYEYYTDDDTSPPTISAVSPASVTVGNTLTIEGTGFTPTATLTIGGQVVSFTFLSQTQITVTIPALAYSGNQVTVQTVTGTANATGFNFVAPIPTITSFAPTSQQLGNTVVITGTNFIGITQVQFGGVNATSFTIDSPTQITATVGAGATGAITVTNMYGTGTRNGFTWLSTIPTLTGFTPNLATAGTDIVITGTNLLATTQVQINGANVHSFVVNSATQVTARVSKTQTSGLITVTTSTGSVISASAVTVDQLLPFPRAGRLMTADSTVINGRNYNAGASSGTDMFRIAEGNVNGPWVAGAAVPQRVFMQFPFALKISQYKINYRNVDFFGQAPKSWQLQGSNNGTAWTTIETVTDIPTSAWNDPNGTANIVRTVPITNDFQYYGLLITATNGGTPVIGELTFDINL